MAIRPILVDKQSPFLGEICALCKEPFGPEQEIILCPQDGTRHHVDCWQLNQNRCAAYGCGGRGEPISRTPYIEDDEDVIEGEVVTEEDSKVRTLPSSNFNCAQSCLVVAIAISIIIFAISCFGIWAILDYIIVEVLGWQYRQPLSSAYSLQLIASHLRLLPHLAPVF